MEITKAISLIKDGGVGVAPTDTIYGLVGSALSKKAVLRIFKIKKRNPKKPLIILISDIKQLNKFEIKLDSEFKKTLADFWPGKTTVILPSSSKKFLYLSRGTKSLAFRLPKNKRVLKMLAKTGPLVAPSANPEGMKPARNINEARKYFGNEVDFYLGGGTMRGSPSRIISIEKGKISVIRK